MSILPGHKSKFDKKFDELIGLRLESIDVGVINTLADSCPARLLPILAISFDVKIDNLSEQEARQMIKNAFEIHYYSGTFYSLNKALKALYSNTKVKEWFSYGGEPYHFKLELDASKNGISLDTLKKSDEIVQAYKNVRSVYDGATIKLTSNIDTYAGGVNFIGEHMTIYPYQIQNLSISAKEHIGGYVKLAEIITPQTLNLKGELK